MRLNILIPLVLVALFGLMGSVYVVPEGHTSIVLNLGRVARSDLGPGLRSKWTLTDSRSVFDPRVPAADATPDRYRTTEREAGTVEFFVLRMTEGQPTCRRPPWA